MTRYISEYTLHIQYEVESEEPGKVATGMQELLEMEFKDRFNLKVTDVWTSLKLGEGRILEE